MKRRKREVQRDGLQQKQQEFLGMGYLLRQLPVLITFLQQQWVILI